MGLLVVGSVALDSVMTPSGHADEVLGGSATYFSTAASFFTDVALVAVVGEDFPEEHVEFLKSRKIDLTGLKRAAGKTFRWKGEYTYRLNEAITLDTKLNVFQDFSPKIPESYKNHEVVFLANIDPSLQRDILTQVKKPKLVASDTMNFWIAGKKDSLLRTLKLVDILIINDGETRDLSGEHNLVKAAKSIMKMGPKTVIVKRGEHGVMMLNSDGIFLAPAYPLESPIDPTGAGDTFAGGFMGYLAKTRNFDNHHLRKAVVIGSVMASFNVEDFSLNRLKKLEYKDIEQRFLEFKKLIHFDDI